MSGLNCWGARRLLPLLAGALFLTVPACGGDDGPTPPPPPPPPPGPDPTVVDASIGESQTYEADGEIVALEFPAASADREYRIAVQSAARSVGSTSMRLILRAGEDASASRTGGRGVLEGSGGWQVSLDEGYGDGGLLKRERIRRNALREAERVGAFPRRRSAEVGPRLSLLPSDQVPAEGDTLRMLMGVQDNLTISCTVSQADTIVGVVKAVGERTVIVEDTLVDDGASAQMGYGDLVDAYDSDILDVLGSYFAEPSDIDGNQRVLAVLTPTVNELTERGSDARVAGFFLPTDLADSGDPDKDGTTVDGTCAAGNEAELVYLLAPDPDEEFGDEVTVEVARRNALGVGAHELYHLVSTSYRLIEAGGGVSDLEETWLDEALAHVSEEVVGFHRVGLGTRQNYELVDVADTQEKVDAFNNFHISNFGRLRRFMRNPEGTRTLALSEPEGVESLEMRGFGWIFLRWLADQEAPSGTGILPGSAEDAFFKELTRGGSSLLIGVDNVEAATGETWESLLAEFAASLQLDDAGIQDVDPRETVLTWDLRDVFEGLNENVGSPGFPEVYPLSVSFPGFASDTLDFDVQASAQKYVTFGSTGSAPKLVIRLMDLSGSALPASAAARIVVMRTQ